MKNRVLVITPVFLAFLGVNALGQEPAQPAQPPQPVRAAPGQGAPPVSPCPRIEVQTSGPRGVREGQPVTFAANIAGGDPKVAPQVIWSVNGGSIRDGQQTRKIEVDTTGAGVYRSVTADVWVGGYSGECMTQASATVRVVPPAAKADEFGELAVEKENERLAYLSGALAQTDDQLYIIAYAGRTNARGYAATALRRMRTQLTETGFDAGRVMVMDGGFREQPAFELWVVPQGAEAPKPSPTVDRREIVYPRATPAPSRRVGKPGSLSSPSPGVRKP